LRQDANPDGGTLQGVIRRAALSGPQLVLKMRAHLLGEREDEACSHGHERLLVLRQGQRRLLFDLSELRHQLFEFHSAESCSGLFGAEHSRKSMTAA
jgi:hypothetical protein